MKIMIFSLEEKYKEGGANIWLTHGNGEPLPEGSYAVLDTGALATALGTVAVEEHYQQLDEVQRDGVIVEERRAKFQGISARQENSSAKVSGTLASTDKASGHAWTCWVIDWCPNSSRCR